MDLASLVSNYEARWNLIIKFYYPIVIKIMNGNWTAFVYSEVLENNSQLLERVKNCGKFFYNRIFSGIEAFQLPYAYFISDSFQSHNHNVLGI